MAELQTEKPVAESCDSYDNTRNQAEVLQGIKRTLSRSPSSEPPQKSPCTLPPHSTSPSRVEGGKLCLTREEQRKTMEGDVQAGGPALSPRTRRKSWRRSTRGRRSLPALSSTSQTLCRTISPSLPEEERLEKLIEASMQLSVQKIQDTLHSIPGANLQLFQTYVESLQKEWSSLAKDISNESQLSIGSTNSDPGIQKAIEHTKKAIHRLQMESSSWESLLNKHRCKAEELAKRVEQGQEEGVTLDPNCLGQSSQSLLILSKPDYHSILSRQQHVLYTMELVMDSQCKMFGELLSFQEQSQLLMKETSSRLAADAGFQDLPSSPIRKLLKGPAGKWNPLHVSKDDRSDIESSSDEEEVPPPVQKHHTNGTNGEHGTNGYLSGPP